MKKGPNKSSIIFTTHCLMMTIGMVISDSAYCQQIKLTFRSGVSFSNFYAHEIPGEIPESSLVTSGGGPIILTPGNNSQTTNYHYEKKFSNDLRIGFHGSFGLNFKFNDRISLEGELGYCQKGIDLEYATNRTLLNSDNSTTTTDYTFNRNLRLDYLVMPVSMHYGIGRKQRLYLAAGIYNAITTGFKINNAMLTTDRKTYSSSGQPLMGSQSVMIHESAYASSFDFGVTGGVGIQYPLSEKFMTGIDVRTAIGLIAVPARFQEHRFLSFSERTKNLCFETALRFQYVLK